MLQKIMNTDPEKTTILIRLLVGSVFLSEGIQKILFPMVRGVGRFQKIGLPSPEFLAPFVGAFEIICGVFILLGFITRLASVPLIIIMVIAISTTKIDILLNQGFWEMLHASRTDWAMLLCAVFLAIKGSGAWSVDRRLVH